MERETGEIRGLPCRSWRCERCSITNRRAFRKRLRLGLTVPDGERPKLLTLTSPPGEDPAISRERLSRRFEELRRRLARAFPGIVLEYAGAVELTQRGAVHFHVILRGVPFMPQPVWSRLAARVGFGYVLDIRQVASVDGMTGYLSKDLGGYLSKDLGARRVWPSHFRRVRFSQAWAPEWVPRGRRPRHEGAAEPRWAFVRCSAYHLDQEDPRAGQGPP